jgi:NADH-quinone oxidoreductase subunit C
MHNPDEKKQIITDMTDLGAVACEADYSTCGYHIEAQTDKSRIRDLATMLYKNEFYLVFVTAVHVQPSIEIIYQFAHFERLCRINCRVKVDAVGTMSTISDIFQGANWHEREVKDMFGISFTGHPNLIPLIISEDDVDLKPLLKNDETLKSSEDVRWKATE